MAKGKNNSVPSSGKRQLSQQQEFEIMKLVLDKFLWLGLAIMIFGLYNLVTGFFENVMTSLAYVIVGAVVLGIFVYILVREYEFMH